MSSIVVTFSRRQAFGYLPLVLALSIVGGFLSWRAFQRSSITPEPDSTGAGRPHRFTAIMGIFIAGLFTMIINLHGLAGMMFHGCER